MYDIFTCISFILQYRVDSEQLVTAPALPLLFSKKIHSLFINKSGGGDCNQNKSHSRHTASSTHTHLWMYVRRVDGM